MKKCRIFGLLLSISLLFSLVTATVFALEEDAITVGNTDNGEVEIDFSEEDVLCSDGMIDSLTMTNKVVFSINSSSEEILSSIKDDSDFFIDGSVIDGGNEVDINEYYDFSNTSKYNIAEWAYSADLISEEEKIECFCDLIIDRNFENITCLSGVFDSIQQYELYNEVSIELGEKIDEIFSVPFGDDADGSEISTMSISIEGKYSSENFTIHYDKSEVDPEEAEEVANYLEEVREFFIEMGFKTPKLQLLKSTYHVYLDPDYKLDDTSVQGCTVPSSSLTNTCASYIVIYKFISLNDIAQEVIAHEYFHAIQCAYNKQSGWFMEACADWGAINVTGNSTTIDDQIYNFIKDQPSLPSTDGYGEVLFPLALHRKYGRDVILSIYEAYNGYSDTIDESDLRDVITEGIQNTGSTENFSDAYRTMASYLYDTEYWYSSICSVPTKWENFWIDERNITKDEDYIRCSKKLDYLTSGYYEFKLPVGFKGTIEIEIQADNVYGKSQVYIKNTDRHIIYYNTTDSSGRSAFTKTDIDGGISSIGLIISNLHTYDSMNFGIKITLYSSEKDYGECGNGIY